MTFNNSHLDTLSTSKFFLGAARGDKGESTGAAAPPPAPLWRRP